jgi:deoxycytidylate deaminase
LVGPIGVDLDAVVESLKEELPPVGYTTEFIRVSDLMRNIPVGIVCRDTSFVDKYDDLIKYADLVCEKCENAAALAGLTIVEIQSRRDRHTERKRREEEVNETIPALGVAYVVRQFKRREEIELLRKTYGRKFVQISVYLGKEERAEAIANLIADYDTTPRTRDECLALARNLIGKDYNEKDVVYGQRVEEVFHLGDVFVPGAARDKIKLTIRRFVRAFFGDNSISPNRDEHGMYMAAAASLRSTDLSRQIGAAIFSSSGEVVSLGCNEVPRAGGGQYWTDDKDPHRDVDEGSDANLRRRMQILHDFIKRQSELGLLKKDLQNDAELQAYVGDIAQRPSIKDSQLMDIIEYGRMIHAEMSAITDAARLGRAVGESTLFCTTFPCHVCAKHIVGSGIRRVVFLEPYPKSYAEELHKDSITFDASVRDKVLFEPFIGLSPRRYRDIFEKGRRKGDDGKGQEWYERSPMPRIEDRSAAYLQNERSAIVASLAEVYDELRPPLESTTSP